MVRPDKVYFNRTAEILKTKKKKRGRKNYGKKKKIKPLV